MLSNVKNLEELKKVMDEFIKKNSEFKYAFNAFNNPVEPPHVVISIIKNINTAADDKVYITQKELLLELTTDKKDIKLENKIEQILFKDKYYEKEESYIPNERCYNVAYFFII